MSLCLCHTKLQFYSTSSFLHAYSIFVLSVKPDGWWWEEEQQQQQGCGMECVCFSCICIIVEYKVWCSNTTSLLVCKQKLLPRWRITSWHCQTKSWGAHDWSPGCLPPQQQLTYTTIVFSHHCLSAQHLHINWIHPPSYFPLCMCRFSFIPTLPST